MLLHFPAFYLLCKDFENKIAALHDLERQIGKSLVYNNGETNIFVGKVSTAKRARMELKNINVFTEPVVIEEGEVEVQEALPPKKRRKFDKPTEEEKVEDGFIWIESDSDTASEDRLDGEGVMVPRPRGKVRERRGSRSRSPPGPTSPKKADGGDTVKVLQLSWYTDSVKAGKVLSMDEYLVYEGHRIAKSPVSKIQPTKLPAASILARAKADSPPPSHILEHNRHKRGYPYSNSQSQRSQHKRPQLISQTTSENEESSSLPPLPEYLNTQYCCQRPTPSPTPNDLFIAQLKKILLVRKLQSDDVGERAYNAAIASIAAYPYTITSVVEILRLPACGPKYGSLYLEWKNTGQIREVSEFETNPRMHSLSIFYEIHDVGAKIAKQFYDKGWRDLDDVIEFGWKTLEPNQQVGVKYYDDFQARIPREEVERIGAVVLQYAEKFERGWQMAICGGYRRGKKMCGDVDVVLTHRDEDVTNHFIDGLVESLEDDGWIRYRLKMSNKNSNRGQEPLNWKGSMPRSRSGFDTLDKALVVWQDPNWPTMDADLALDEHFKNPNMHRRVDIILTPWKTAGCAIVGWTGGTMFERDIRRYCRHELGYKFDSSGVRRLDNGEWVDLEGDETSLDKKERRVFEGLGLEWREPTLRCTDG